MVGLFSGNLFHIHMLFDIAAGSPSGTLFVFVACIFVSSDLLQTNLNNFTIAHVLTYFPLPYMAFCPTFFCLFDGHYFGNLFHVSFTVLLAFYPFFF